MPDAWRRERGTGRRRAGARRSRGGLSAVVVAPRLCFVAALLQPRRRRATRHGGAVSYAAYRIEHETRYAHTSGVSTSQHVAYLMPRELPHQRVRQHELVIDPPPASCVQRVDYFGNTVSQFTILSPYDELSVFARSLVDVCAPDPPAVPSDSAPWETVREALLYARSAPFQAASEFSYASPYAAVTPELAEFARDSFAPTQPIVEGAIHLMHRIHEQFVFDPEATTIATPVTRVLADRRGVCQDF